MRLLLLISALLTALTGVTGTRAAAQPVQASAAATIALPRLVAVSPVTSRFTVPAYGTVPPLQLVAPRLVSVAAARVLYAERRRE
ncbi:hypothetical protein [Sphingomonas bacterium]|uniref:hypothetical protein n=1 Tax=Sphingomonas bacterium TaxID=1895847 RepID=UPI001575615A|nr:hypothetical protein [Sphingomonas bacterium]